MASIVIALLVIGSWLLPEGSFDDGPYAFHSKYETIEECESKQRKDTVCAYHNDGKGAMLYKKHHGGTIRVEFVGTEE